LLVVCGLNQQTPLEYREKIAIQSSNLASCLFEIQQLAGVQECMALSTCHRTEIYAVVEHPDVLIHWWQTRHQMIWPQLETHFYCHQQQDSLIHSLRVACGLDSMLIGEPQILGQLKQAYHEALELKFASNRLMQWFDFVFQMTKKIRTQSGINQLPVSVASVAVDSIQNIVGHIQNKKVLIIGSGETARLSAIHLQEKGCRDFMVTSRHLEHANSLALQLEGKAFIVTELNDYMHLADIVVTATSCPLPFITKPSMEQTLSKRQNRPMILVDLAVPRDIEPEVAELQAIQLINIDHLKEIQEKNQVSRQKAGQVAEKMIHAALDVYSKKNKTKTVQNLICDYRAYMQNLAQDEVRRAHQKLASGHCQYQVVEELSERLMQKLMHQPTVGLQKAAIDEKNDVLEMAQYLFNPHQKETNFS
jgi:glutamyl-tRNA reductase